jgi:hypothetical protein
MAQEQIMQPVQHIMVEQVSNYMQNGFKFTNYFTTIWNYYSILFNIMEEKLAALETENMNLKAKIKQLKQVIDDMIENDPEHILDFFNCCGSIRKTALKYGMEMEELYERISVWDECYASLHAADDFEECRIEVIGRKEYDKELESYLDPDELLSKTRELDADEIKNIIDDCKNSELSLYDIADRHELKIDYLFKILKDNGIIEKETDVRGYANFYKEYLGARKEWDGKSEFGFLNVPEVPLSKCCCETITDVKCPDCDCFICKDCWIHKIDYAAQIDDLLCDDCYRNRDPTIRGKCISCEYIDNLEEGAECNNCGHWVCVSCVSYKDDGNYYCVEC